LIIQKILKDEERRDVNMVNFLIQIEEIHFTKKKHVTTFTISLPYFHLIINIYIKFI